MLTIILGGIIGALILTAITYLLVKAEFNEASIRSDWRILLLMLIPYTLVAGFLVAVIRLIVPDLKELFPNGIPLW